MLVVSIGDSIKSVVWAFGLLFMIMYVVGIYFTQIVTTHKVANVDNREADKPLELLYGSLACSMMTLFESIASGVSWREVVNPLWWSISAWLVPIYVLYVAFTIFVVLNVVTGVFVGSATEKAKSDTKMVLLYQLRELFRRTDTDASGVMNLEKFCNNLEDENLQKYMKAIDLDSAEAYDLFLLLDADDSDEVDEDEFVNGCLRLHGFAKAIDLATLTRDYKQWTMTCDERLHEVQTCLDRMIEHIEGQAGP